MVAEVQGDPDRGDRTPVELAFPADVVELHAKRGGGGEAREHDGRREHERRRQGTVREEGGVEHPAIGRARVVAGREEHDGHEQEGDGDRAERYRDGEPARLVEPPLEPYPSSHLRPPAMR